MTVGRSLSDCTTVIDRRYSDDGHAPTATVLTDYATLEPGQRNVLRLIFSDPHVRAAQPDWESVARFMVAAFRADVARAGTSKRARHLVEELSRRSPEFAAMWKEHDVRTYGEGTKLLRRADIEVIYGSLKPGPASGVARRRWRPPARRGSVRGRPATRG